MLNLAALATDQALLQRLFTTRSKQDAVRSVLANAVLQLPVLVLLGLLGSALFAFYRGREPELASLPSPDAIVPYFAVQQLPPVLSALAIAAIFAASMAVMSAGINSLSTAATVDFYQRVWRGTNPVRFGRMATVAWGMVATALAFWMGRLGELAVAYNKVSGFLSGPVLGIFLLGMATRRATGSGVLFGAAAGTAAVAAVAAWSPVSFFYYSPIGLAATVAAGWGASLLTAPPRPEQLRGLVLGDEPRLMEAKGCEA
jgi:Na+/proline symporter